MIRKWKLLLVGVSCVMGTAMAQNNPILLFPKGAPGETTKLIEKADADGGKTGGETILRITNVSEPTITVYPAPTKWRQVLPLWFVRVVAIISWLMTWKAMKFVSG